MLELISQERYCEKATPVDIGPYHNHGTPFDTAVAAGTVPGRTAVAFPNTGSRVSNHKPSGLDLSIAIVDSATTALLYYFLYPLHQEALENCEKAGEGQSFATYAGEWGCIALLIDSSGVPRFVGLTSRNVGAPSQVATEDARVGMTLFAWTAVDKVTSGLDQHPKIFVSRGTHGHYVSHGPFVVTPFSGGNDPTRGSCGAIENADQVISAEITIPGDRWAAICARRGTALAGVSPNRHRPTVSNHPLRTGGVRKRCSSRPREGRQRTRQRTSDGEQRPTASGQLLTFTRS